MRNKKKFVELDNSRTEEQIKVMEEIIQADHCPFCLENLRKYHKKPILFEGEHWVVTENQWPYTGTKLHFLFIFKKHREELELSTEEVVELYNLRAKICSEYKIKGGGFCVRFGEPTLSGATVRHLHYHLMEYQKNDEAIKFYIGSNEFKT